MEILKLLITSGTIVALLKLCEQFSRWWMAKKGKGGDQLECLEQGLRAILHDRIKYLGRRYCREEYIKIDDRDDLVTMHNAYKRLNGNGNLDILMSEVMRLPHD